MYKNKFPAGQRSCDCGPAPYVVSLPQAARQNAAFRAALWTGSYLQLTLMCIPPRDDIGLEMHPDTDQLIRVEEGQGIVRMGCTCDCQDMQRELSVGDAVFVPAGMWHNIINTGCRPLRLSSVYAPPHHPRGTLHRTKRDAENAPH